MNAAHSPRNHILRNIVVIAWAFFAIALAPVAHGIGTAANSVVNNTARVDYTVSGVPGFTTDTTSFTVEELINVIVTWQDGANVAIATPATGQVLTFLVTNTGNGLETFSLSVDNTNAADNFDPVFASIYLDNGNNVFDGLASEILYNPGVNDPVLDANGTDAITVYAANHIPGSLVLNDTGISRLSAISTTTGAAAATVGTVLVGAGDGGVDAVVGAANATGVADGVYEVTTVPSVTSPITKSVQVIADPSGCSTAPCLAVTGATVRYSLQVSVSGGTAETLVITDVIPAEVSYIGDSVTIDTVAKSDIADADEVTVAAGTITVTLGDVAGGSTFTIEFDATIN